MVTHTVTQTTKHVMTYSSYTVDGFRQPYPTSSAPAIQIEHRIEPQIRSTSEEENDKVTPKRTRGTEASDVCTEDTKRRERRISPRSEQKDDDQEPLIELGEPVISDSFHSAKATFAHKSALCDDATSSVHES